MPPKKRTQRQVVLPPQAAMAGGNIFNDIYDHVLKPTYEKVLKPTHDFVKKNKIISRGAKIVSYGATALGHPEIGKTAGTVSTVADQLGYGKRKMIQAGSGKPLVRKSSY